MQNECARNENDERDATSDSPPISISVIIPCWKDLPRLRALLLALSALRGVSEVIVANVSCGDEARALTAEFGAKLVSCEQPNRGKQMNAGAAAANGEMLLFHHADSELTQAHIDSLTAVFSKDRDVIGGAFYRKFDGRHSHLRWLESVTRLLSRCGGTLYGDQSIFVRSAHFEKLGGYAEIPLMEDCEFSRRLRRSGKVKLLDPPIFSSPRRHEQQGAWKTSLQNGAMILLFKLGVSPVKLHRWYYRQKRSQAAR